MRLLIILFLILINMQSFGAIFVPTSFESLLDDAGFVVVGKFQKAAYKELSGEIFTEAYFTLEESAGLRASDLLNRNEFKIVMRGGVWQGYTYRFDGVPAFEKEENVLLLVNKTIRGFELSNLAYSKFQILSKNGKRYISSVVFPDSQILGNIPWPTVEKKIGDRYGSPLSRFPDDRQAVVSKKNLSGLGFRRPAQVENSVNKADRDDDEESSSTFLLIIVFGAMGLVYTKIQNKQIRH